MSDRIISCQDTCVDWKRSGGEEGRAKYRLTGDLSKLVMHEGKAPRVFFTIRDLSYDDYQEVIVFAATPGIAADRAFRYGVVQIEGVEALCAGGAWRPKHERVSGDGTSLPTATPADMRDIFKALAPRHILDVGATIQARAEMDREGNGAGGGA